MNPVIDKGYIKNINNYITMCFKDAFSSENRKYSEDAYRFAFILIKDIKNKWHIQPFMWCKYGRVQMKVAFRLRRNFEKRFSIIYGDNKDLRILPYEGGDIDPNYTEIMLKINDNILAKHLRCTNGFVSLSIFDKETESRPEGSVLPAARFEKLVCTYYSIDPSLYDTEVYEHPGDDFQDWEKFTQLYEKAFGVPIGKGYETICSDNLERI